MCRPSGRRGKGVVLYKGKGGVPSRARHKEVPK